MSTDLLIGVARTDITPPVGSLLVGYRLRASTSIGHRLRAEALAVRQGPSGWVLVTCDLCALSRPLVLLVREGIARRTALAPQAVMVAADHTHSGPAANAAGWWTNHPDQAYLDELRDKLVAVASEAWQQAAPGRLEAAYTSARELASNRRIRDTKGRWRNEWSDPRGEHTGFFDPTVTLTGVRRPDGRLDALLITYGCHPVVLGIGSLAISSDYCGYLKDALEQSGSVGTVLFGVAGHGNIDPRVCVQNDAAPAEAMGRSLAAAVQAALPSLAPIDGGAVACHSQPWSITRTRCPKEEPGQQFLRLMQVGETFETEVQALRAGDLGIVGLPGETVSEIVAAIRTASPLKHPVVLSLANDTVGYIPTDEIQSQGAHETNYSPAEGLERPALEHARKALAAVASER